MKKPMQYNIQGIKCDNKECDFKDMSVKVEDYPDWLNKPCPKCGSNLLTQADYNNVKRIIKLVNFFNRFLPSVPDSTPIKTMSVEMDGTGKVDFKEKSED